MTLNPYEFHSEVSHDSVAKRANLTPLTTFLAIGFAGFLFQGVCFLLTTSALASYIVPSHRDQATFAAKSIVLGVAWLSFNSAAVALLSWSCVAIAFDHYTKQGAQKAREASRPTIPSDEVAGGANCGPEIRKRRKAVAVLLGTLILQWICHALLAVVLTDVAKHFPSTSIHLFCSDLLSVVASGIVTFAVCAGGFQLFRASRRSEHEQSFSHAAGPE